jgi:hypothetical protein
MLIEELNENSNLDQILLETMGSAIFISYQQFDFYYDSILHNIQESMQSHWNEEKSRKQKQHQLNNQ